MFGVMVIVVIYIEITLSTIIIIIIMTFKPILGDIWSLFLAKNCTQATNVTLHLISETIWGHIWRSHWNAKRTANLYIFESEMSSKVRYTFTLLCITYSLTKNKIHNWWNSSCSRSGDWQQQGVCTALISDGQYRLLVSARLSLTIAIKWRG